MSKREQKRKKLEQAFKDFFEYEEPLSRLPPHRILAINRGERADMLKVKIDVDLSAMIEAAENLLAVIDGLTPADTGQFFDWAGKPVPW